MGLNEIERALTDRRGILSMYIRTPVHICVVYECVRYTTLRVPLFSSFIPT